MCRDKEFVSLERGWRSGGFTAWSIFKPDTKYFQPSTKPFMLNFRLDGLLEKLRG
jgi:hypothetical protein